VIGRRLQPVNGRLPASFWEDGQPGDYCGPIMGYTGDVPAVFFLKPNARDEDAPPAARGIQHVTSPPHVFTEMPDGSLQIRESISDYKAHRGPESKSDGWHGYLDAGHVWRQV
jgi:hypothetical protein